MNISRSEQRVLHALAQGGHILHERGGDSRRITEILCVTRDGFILSDCSLAVFQRLRAKRLIASADGAPYRITRLGRQSVRAQPDNR
ncbi:YjhX family toxin [Gemmobacter serpentinus]|uniref:YjhX family toxin n=1 Tax=Gemmobacter serpentinus TaxID=2652247 RepID=UPI00124D79CD|nr:YjhX family toxin [Gemmobacter serpentinus]